MTVLTVLAGFTGSSLPVGGLGRACRASRLLGEAATSEASRGHCARARFSALGRSWFPYNDDQYERGAATTRRSTPPLSRPLAEQTRCSCPGIPLTHPDHAWLARLGPLWADLPCERVGLYVEQPYTWLTTGVAREPSPVAIADLVPAELGLVLRARVPSSRETAARSPRACLTYRSQLPLLGRRRIPLRAIASDPNVAARPIAWLPR